jgi:hypothetical protein
MNRNEAMEYDNALKKKLEHIALQYDLEESIGDYIVDNYIMVIPEYVKKDMIFLGENRASYKAGNVKLDLKKALIAGLELVASVSKPESIYNYIQLLIVAAFFIEKSAKQEINKIEAYIVYLLHVNGIYNAGIEEERFISELQDWYKEKEGEPLERGKIIEAINHLYEIKVVDFENGYIFLKEKVFGQVE